MARRSQVEAAQRLNAFQRRTRKEFVPKFAREIEKYGAALGREVERRVRKRKALTTDDGQRTTDVETKGLPPANALIEPEDGELLEEIVRRFDVELIRVSWDAWNAALNVEIAFDLIDPAVTAATAETSTRVRMITETTREELRSLLAYGNENGWSIRDLINGDENRRGIKAFIEESYARRAETIARTELGWAQQKAATGRYAAAGVEKVLVLDNGLDDDDEPCQEANGAVWTLEKADANPLEHPNCTRAFAPQFDSA